MVIFNIVILSGSCYPFNMVIFLSFLHVYQRVNHMPPYYTISIHFHYFPKSKMYTSIYTPYILLTSKYQRYPQHVTSHLPAISPYYTIYYTIWGWVKTLVPCREPQVIAGLKWMFIPLKYGIYRYWPIPILRIETKNVYIYIHTHHILHIITPYMAIHSPEGNPPWNSHGRRGSFVEEIDARDLHRRSPVSWACQKGHLEVGGMGWGMARGDVYILYIYIY